MNELTLPQGWNYQENLETISGIMPKELPPYQGIVLIVASHGECSVHGTIKPHGLYSVEERLWRRYGSAKIDWVLYTDAHTNYWENKHLLKEAFEYFPNRNDFFVVKHPTDVISKLPELAFLDESEAKEERAEKFYEEMKSMLFGGKPRQQLVDEAKQLREFQSQAIRDIESLLEINRLLRSTVWLHREINEYRDQQETALEVIEDVLESLKEETYEDRESKRRILEKLITSIQGKGEAV
jgi:hypothetical protein